MSTHLITLVADAWGWTGIAPAHLAIERQHADRYQHQQRQPREQQHVQLPAGVTRSLVYRGAEFSLVLYGSGANAVWSVEAGQ